MLKTYKCHKEVQAFKIKTLFKYTNGEGWLSPNNDSSDIISVTKEYMQKHKPKIGGYYVVYEDGYQSFSPAKAFEDGYTLK